MSSVTPYNIAVADEKLKQLRQKLEHTTFPDELDASGWDMGVPLLEIKRLVAVWRDQFDWRAQELKLNEQLKQVNVRVGVEGFGELNLHAVHHPRPGSFLEVTKLIPLLTTNNGDGPVFDVVAPSLPNFGFSQGVKKAERIRAGTVRRSSTQSDDRTRLRRIRQARFIPPEKRPTNSRAVIQGGDWGSMIARTMSQCYPQHTKAIHLNYIPITPPYPWRSPYQFLKSLLSVPFSAKDRGSLARTMGYLTRGNAYMKQQETRPQTLGYGLHDSPVGLLAWIYDKMHTWSDKYPWTDEEILTWVSVYYFSTAGPMASTRIYYEASAPKRGGSTTVSEDGAQEDQLGKADLKYMPLEQVLGARAPQSVRFAVVQFREEIVVWPMAWCRSIGNVVQETECDRGGHFAAWEEPELLASDIKRFLGNNGPAYGAVANRDGY
ncbi:Alpha/beta hydrolase fold-1 [Penicillium italicum]|uniref:Alpha/beta hydrolase fold-1 n=1 Tax=Penicillium italicum TaxID=40296 RepID=A0A0A2L7Z6_PENIT|nr:Alpha/beta hydrolase fold-1 [Penicillium italicum]